MSGEHFTDPDCENSKVFLTLDQLLAFLDERRRFCSHCSKKSKWFSDYESPSYCDDHYPYKEIDSNEI